MTSKEQSNGHQKHAFLEKPLLGKLHRHELAILGTPCGNIKKLAFALADALQSQMRVGYIDADHKSADEEREKGRDPRSILGHGGDAEMTDKITFDRLDLNRKATEFERRAYFQGQDYMLVNGNHFRANRQVVVIDPRKSLEKRIDQLTDVRLLLTTEEGLEIPELLKEHVPHLEDIPQMSIKDIEGIAAFILADWKSGEPPLKGLVLAGGRSTRMGQDKGRMDYHGQDQRIYMLEELNKICQEAFVSIRPDQSKELEDVAVVEDTFLDLGPFGAILSAFRQDPNAAWLVVACDQPFLNAETLSHLVAARNRSKVATCYHNPETDFPEPLITIWEPRAYPVLLNFLSQGYSCPRKALINTDCEVIEAPDVNMLRNANTPEEYKESVEAIATRD